MKVNKIGISKSKKTLSDLNPGDLFEWNGRLFIKTNKQETIISTGCLCVVLCDGRVKHIEYDTPINEVVLDSIDDDTINYRIK